MADIFDTLQESPKQDIFDEVSAPAQRDIFDEVASEPNASLSANVYDRQDQLDKELRVGAHLSGSDAASYPELPTASPEQAALASTAAAVGSQAIRQTLMPSRMDARNSLPYSGPEGLYEQSRQVDAAAQLAAEKAAKTDPLDFAAKFEADRVRDTLRNQASGMAEFAESKRPQSVDEITARMFARNIEQVKEKLKGAGPQPPVGVTTLSSLASGLLNQISELAPDSVSPDVRNLAAGARDYSQERIGNTGAVERGLGQAGSLIVGNPEGKLALLAGALRGALQSHAEVLRETGSKEKADQAALDTLPVLGAYMLTGSAAGRLGRMVIAEDAAPLTKALGAFTGAEVANIGTSAVIHAANDVPYDLSSFSADTLMALSHSAQEYKGAVSDAAKAGARAELKKRGFSDEQIAKPPPETAVTPADQIVPTEQLPPSPLEGKSIENPPLTTTENAQSIESPSAPDGSLRSRSQLQELPAEESSQGVQPSGQGELVPEARGQASPEVADIVPAIRVGGQLVRGEPGDTHIDILTRYIADKPEDVQANAIGDFDSETNPNLFVGPDNQPISRAELKDRFGVSDSQGLKALQEAPPEPTRNLGPGAANIEEAQPAKPIGAYNAKVDEQRAARGLEPLISDAKKADPVTWAKTEAKIEADPSFPDRLVDEINSGARKSVTDEDQAALLWQMVDLKNRRDMAQDRADAPDTSQPDRVEALLEADHLEQKLQQTELADRKAGTSSGRALRFRRVLANEDYTLAGIERKMRRATKRPLTPEERQQAKTEADKLDALKQEADAADLAAAEKQGNIGVDQAIADIEREAKKNPAFTPEVKSIADRIVAYLDSKADAALKRWRSKMGQANAGVDPTLLVDAAIIGAAKIGKGFVRFGQWGSEMVKTLGEAIKPHLEEVWNASNQRVDERVNGAPAKVREKVKQAVTKSGTEEFEKGIADKMKARVKDGDKLTDLRGYVNKLVESIVRSGVKDRDVVVDRVHDVLKEIDPKFTRRQTVDAISGYGDFKPLNPDETKAQVRDIKGQLQQVAKLEDIQSKVPLQKTGVERRVPSTEERNLIQQVNEAKKKFGVVVTDPATQLKSALDGIATRLANQVKDITRQIETGEQPKAKTPAPSDDRTDMLRALRDRVRQTLTEIEGTPKMSEADRIKLTTRALESHIRDLQRQIETGETKQPRKGVNSPEIERLRNERDILRAQLDEVKAADTAVQEGKQFDAVMKSAADLEKKLAANDLSQKGKVQGPDTEMVTAAKEHLKGLREEMEKRRKDANPPRPEEEVKLENAMKAVEKSIAEYDERLKKGDISTAPKKPGVSSPELDAKRAERDAMAAHLAELRREANKPTADEVKRRQNQRDIEAAKKAITDLDAKIQSGDLSPKPSNAREVSPEVEDLRAQRDAMRKLLTDMRQAAKPKASPYDVALKSYKTRLATRTADLEAKLAVEDFTKPPKKAPLKLDPEALAARAKYERAKLLVDQGIERKRLKDRPITEKVLDATAKWTRASVLSGISTLAKLTSAAFMRVAFNVPEEIVGSVARRVFPSVAKRAPVEGTGLQVGTEAKAIIQGLTQGFKDSVKIIRTGHSDLDAVYGRRDVAPRSFLDFFGALHGALKAPVKRVFFERGFAKRLEAAAREGADISDPFVQMKIGADAYKDANRSIFMQDNRLVEGFQAMLARWSAPDKITGKVPLGGKLATTAAKVLVPVVRIPANIVAETLGNYVAGLPVGVAKALHAVVTKSAENLSPDEADAIMRQMKKGSVGASLLLLGFFAPQIAGGYYSPGNTKKKEGEAGFGEVKVGGHVIPKVLVHNPLMEAMQIGATARKVADSKLRKKDTENQGLMAGIGRALLGISEEVPFIGETMHLGDLKEAHGGEKFIGNLVKAQIPQILQQIASYRDKDAKGNTVRRKQDSVLDAIKSGIPGLRETLPRK